MDFAEMLHEIGIFLKAPPFYILLYLSLPLMRERMLRTEGRFKSRTIIL